LIRVLIIPGERSRLQVGWFGDQAAPSTLPGPRSAPVARRPNPSTAYRDHLSPANSGMRAAEGADLSTLGQACPADGGADVDGGMAENQESTPCEGMGHHRQTRINQLTVGITEMYAFTGPRVIVVQQRTRCGSMKGNLAEIGPEAIPEGASVCRTDARKKTASSKSPVRELERQRTCATSVQIQLSRLFSEMSPSARTSKGFLIVGTRFTSSSRQFKNAISRIRRFAA